MLPESINGLWLRIKGLFRRRQLERDLDDEIQFHLAMREEKLAESGVAAKEARHAARRRFGNATRAKETSRELWTFPLLETFWQDIRYGLRQLRRNPGFTIVAIVTLALGIGANTAIFSLVNAVMLRTLPVPAPHQLVLFMWRADASGSFHSFFGVAGCPVNGGPSSPGSCLFSGPLFERIHREQRSFAGTFAFRGTGSRPLMFRGHVGHAQGELVSGGYFPTLRVPAAIGRTLEPSDDSLSAAPAIVLSHGLWEQQFGADPAVVGETVYLNGYPFTVVGVAASSFFGLNAGMRSDFWAPMAFAKSVTFLPNSLSDPHAAMVAIAARLKQGVSMAQAQAVTSAIFARDATTGPDALFKPRGKPRLILASLAGGMDSLRQEYSKTLLLVLVLTAIILLLASANVAGLALARSTARQKEIAVRLALGTTRRRLIRQLLTESLQLAGAGGALGVLLAYWGARSSAAFLSANAGRILLDVHPDLRVLGFAILLTAGAGVLAGLAPAFRATRVDLTPALNEPSGSQAGAGRSWHRFGLGSALVVGQAALSILVLVSAVLLARSVGNRESRSFGFQTKNLLTFYPDPTLTGMRNSQLATLYHQLRTRLAALPGVVSVTYSSRLPMGQGLTAESYTVAGRPWPRSWGMSNMLYEMRVGPGFFKTLGVPVVAGRALNAADFSSAASPEPIVVNQVFARQAFGSENPLGQTLRFPPARIVGVAGDTNYESPLMDSEHWPLAYFPLGSGAAEFEIRTAGDPKALIPAIRRVVSEANSDLVLTNPTTATDQIAKMLYQERLIAWLSSLFAVLALMLACIGLYGLLAWEVARRTREIGIRMALGAERAAVLGMVLRRGATLAIAGAVAGLVLAIGLTHLLQHFLFGVSATDPVSFAAVACLLLMTALLACWIPARRAMRVDPVTALKYE